MWAGSDRYDPGRHLSSVDYGLCRESPPTNKRVNESTSVVLCLNRPQGSVKTDREWTHTSFSSVDGSSSTSTSSLAVPGQTRPTPLPSNLDGKVPVTYGSLRPLDDRDTGPNTPFISVGHGGSIYTGFCGVRVGRTYPWEGRDSSWVHSRENVLLLSRTKLITYYSVTRDTKIFLCPSDRSPNGVSPPRTGFLARKTTAPREGL